MFIIKLLFFYFIKLTLAEIDSSSSDLLPLILYGTKARIEDYPFFAATEFCGASILSERWLLTAAHCVDDKVYVGKRLVFVGGDRLDNSIQLRYDWFIIHPKYTRGSMGPISNDIALLRLETPLRFSNKVKPVKLPTTTSSNQRLVFIGRGKDETGRGSVSLMKMDVSKLSTQECIRGTTSDIYNRLFMDQTLLCGRRINGGPGICLGDSGSPLLQNGTIVGVASFFISSVKDCHKASGNIGYYTNVSTFVPWIKSVTGLQ